MSGAAVAAAASGRQAYLDRARGLAVLIMIEAHVLDGWTRLDDRHTNAFGYAMILGGFAAPLFLFLAGLSLVLSAESKYRKTGNLQTSWWAVQKRGWQVFGLAFLFRLQAYILTGGYSLVGLLKVDILNIMGPAMAFAAFLGARVRARGTRALLFGLVATSIAMLTPIVRTTSLLNWLPDPVEWYFRPTAGRTNFTLFPWAGFVFAGAAVGLFLDGLRNSERTFRMQMALAAVSLLLMAAAYEASFLPSIYEKSEFWTSSPTFFFLRVGLVSLLLPVAFAWEQAPWRGMVSRWSPVEELGRASLFVYWVHVEMVYGFISRPLRRNLSFPAAIVADLLFSVFLLGLVLLKNRRLAIRKADGLRPSSPAHASI
jgi:uncharacterized membrane protein